MERRLAITYSVSATATLGIACFTFAAIGGGIFVNAAPKSTGEGKTVEFIDDYIVLHSSTTLAPIDPAVAVDLSAVAAGAPAASGGSAANPQSSAQAAAAPASADAAIVPAAAEPDAALVTPAAAPDAAPAPAPEAAPGAAPAPAPSPSPASAPPNSTTPATTLPKSTTTTLPKTTTTTPSSSLPPGVRIPSDWPSGRPIPPIPPGCREPQLEDNGVWNCDD